MRKSLLLLIIGFGLGVLSHALVFPDFMANGIVLIPDRTIENAKLPPQPTLEPSTITITYNGSFSRHNVTVPFTRYIVIRNESENTQMWLDAELPQLSTVRGYAYGEQVRSRMDKKGQFIVQDKNNPHERLLITVK